MNKYQEALEILNHGYVWQTEHRREVLEAEKVIEQLVDRSTPKKPNIVREPFAYISYNCGECDEPVLRSWAGEIPRMMPKFCQYCGQAIDWSKDE